MSGPEQPDETNWRRRAVLLLLVAILVVLGAGIGSFIFGDTPPPDDGTETAPTPTATPGDGPPSTGTDAPTTGPDETATPPPDTPTEEQPEAPTETPTTGRGSGEDDDDGGGPTTPSPGLELGDDSSLFSGSGLVPGGSGQGTLTVRNAADEEGNLTISAIDVVDEENGIVDPEAAVDSSPNTGELSSNLEVRVSVRDGSGDEEYLLGTDGGYITLSHLPSRIPSVAIPVASGEEVTVITEWRLPSSTGNEVQSDGVTVDVGLTLQSTN